MRCTLDPLHIRHMRQGDMISWHRRPLHLTSDPVRTGGEWSAEGTWEGHMVRVTQAPGEEVLVWAERKKNDLSSK